MIKYCVDCPYYVPGGFCKKKNKIAGALNDSCIEAREEITHEEVPEGMKVCTKCKRTLPLASFSKHKSKKDGLQCTCKECSAKAKRRNN